MPDNIAIENAADILYAAYKNKAQVKAVRELIGAKSIKAAYQVQQINVERELNEGEEVIGKKIGLTSFAVQEQLGVDQPDYGVLYASTKLENGGTVSFEDLIQPKAEAEIAFVVGKDLEGEMTLKNLVDAIDYAVASIEIVGSRVENWDITIADTIADNASASHFVLGDKKVELKDLDLVNCKMKMTKNDDLASEGIGKACMGNPLNAALWLAKVMAENGTPIKKGEILLSGALGPMVIIEQGDTFNAEIEGLGSVSVTIN